MATFYESRIIDVIVVRATDVLMCVVLEEEKQFAIFIKYRNRSGIHQCLSDLHLFWRRPDVVPGIFQSLPPGD